MSFRATTLRRSYLPIFFVGLIFAPTVHGQLTNTTGQIISPIAFANQGAVITSFVAPPSLSSSSDTGGGGGGGARDAGQWFKVEFHYGTTAAVKAEYPYVDAVQFKVWIEGRDLYDPAGKAGEGIAVGLTGTVTYVNVPVGKDLYGVVYVHPATIARYSDSRGSEDFDRKFDVHVEAYVGGTLVDAIDKNGAKETDKNWFKALKAVPDLVYRQDQCPFIVDSPTRYPQIKPPAASQ